MAPNSLAWLAMEAMMVLIPMILSLTVHEFAHALAAQRCGDPTAAQLGRLTLNPLAHIDPFGTVLLPFGMLLLSGAGGLGRLPLFGFAKPTPVDAGRFHRHISVRRGSFWVALAGPLANLLLAFICALLMSGSVHAWGNLWQPGLLPAPMWQFLRAMLSINLSLCVFNLLPLSPLDGQKIVVNILPLRQAWHFEQFNQRYGTYILWGLVLFGTRFLVWPINALAQLILTLVGLA